MEREKMKDERKQKLRHSATPSQTNNPNDIKNIYKRDSLLVVITTQPGKDTPLVLIAL